MKIKSFRIFCSGLLDAVTCLNLYVQVSDLAAYSSLDELGFWQNYFYTWNGNYTFTPANDLS